MQRLVVALAVAAFGLTSGPVAAAPSRPPPAPPPAPDSPAQQSVPVPLGKCERQPKNARYQVTLKRDAELQDLVEWMMSVSCQKFIWDPGIRGGKINIVAPEPVTLVEAYAAFYAALQTMGLTVEPAGAYYKVVEIDGKAGVGARDLPVYGPQSTPPPDDRYVTKLIQPPASSRDDVLALIEALKTSRGTVESVGEILLVTDTGHRIRRMLELIEAIEAAPQANRRVFLYGIRYAEPEALVEVLRGVFPEADAATTAPSRPARRSKRGKAPQSGDATLTSSQPSTPGPSIHIDPRTGTLVVVGSAEQYAPIRRLVEELDVPNRGSAATLHVLTLRHADAQEVQTLLTGLSGEETKATAEAKTADEIGLAVTGSIKVTAHAATQTIVVAASQSDFQAVKRVVEAIDRPQRQLYIELYLLEVRANNDLEFGAGGHYGKLNDDGSLGLVSSSPGGTNALRLLSQKESSSVLGNLTAAFIGPNLPGYEIPAFGVVLQALETREDVNVIARPHMYAAENQEASVEFGDVVPMNAGSTVLPGTGGGQQFNVQREPVGIAIKLLPKVNDDLTVTMDIALEDNQLGAPDPSLNAYRTSQRKLDLKQVIAYPGQPVVLGGLVKESDKVTDNQVPGLGSIPLLGWLFKNRIREKERVTLLMVLVPHIIDSPDDARRIHAQRLAERMDFIQRHTAFERKDLDAHINYRKKAGLLAAINHTARQREEDAFEVDQARRELERPQLDKNFDLHGTDKPNPPTPYEAE